MPDTRRQRSQSSSVSVARSMSSLSFGAYASAAEICANLTANRPTPARRNRRLSGITGDQCIVQRKPQELRSLLAGHKIVSGPAVYDCIGAMLAEQCGFEMAFTSGFGMSAALLGKPDLGLLSVSEIIDQARRIAASVEIPIIVDLDTGYGDVLNVVRCIEEAVAAGFGGVILEDQQWPKRCGHFDGKRLVPVEEHAAKIRAACHARGDSGLVIVGRTDARAVEGLRGAIERGHACISAGADVLFIEAPESVDELQAIAEEFSAVPLMANPVEGGRTPCLSADEFEQLGYRLCAFAITGLLASVAGMREAFDALRDAGRPATTHKLDLQAFKRIIGFDACRELQDRLHPQRDS